MTPFRINDAQFIESAYISGQSKLTVSTRDLSNGRSLGASVVQAILGVPGGMFVQHQNRWNFIPWANVKSTQLVDVPLEIAEAAAQNAETSDAPGSYLRTQAANYHKPGPIATPVQQAAPTLPAEVGQVPLARRGPGRPRKVQPEAVAPSDIDDLVGGTAPAPAALPARDEMGVLLAIQPTDGPKIQCSACYEVFVQGSNHVCKKLPV